MWLLVISCSSCSVKSLHKKIVTSSVAKYQACLKKELIRLKIRMTGSDLKLKTRIFTTRLSRHNQIAFMALQLLGVWPRLVVLSLSNTWRMLNEESLNTAAVFTHHRVTSRKPASSFFFFFVKYSKFRLQLFTECIFGLPLSLFHILSHTYTDTRLPLPHLSKLCHIHKKNV